MLIPNKKTVGAVLQVNSVFYVLLSKKHSAIMLGTCLFLFAVGEVLNVNLFNGEDYLC